ncbi:NDR1/HIN1-like protein 26 [Elaeis guineensis]|uniref:NDR1/HIN1-like protein 26 n=1 Tax=Elaeis guineensis var. tenera TaxID=51953 RepID=A0A6I9RTQ0_ELAGV|nr:NDR1/HIN1-like protein 26 [Elaeis guineensis]
MSSAFRSPVPTQTRSHHHRFSASRVRESLTTRFAMCVCSVLLSLLLFAGVIVFILWLSLRPHRPRFYLSSFSVPAVAQPPSALLNSPISFNVTDRNPNGNIGIYYDVVYASVYHRDQLVGSGPVLNPFYQPHKNTTVVVGDLTGTAPAAGDALAAELSGDAAAGRVEFRLELKSVIRFRVKTWDTHHHTLHVQCDVVVGSDGNLLAGYRDKRCSIYFGSL